MADSIWPEQFASDNLFTPLGKLNDMKHLKTEVKEVRKGMECGLTFDKFADFQEGDLIQAYDTIEKPRSLYTVGLSFRF